MQQRHRHLPTQGHGIREGMSRQNRGGKRTALGNVGADSEQHTLGGDIRRLDRACLRRIDLRCQPPHRVGVEQCTRTENESRRAIDVLEAAVDRERVRLAFDEQPGAQMRPAEAGGRARHPFLAGRCHEGDQDAEVHVLRERDQFVSAWPRCWGRAC